MLRYLKLVVFHIAVKPISALLGKLASPKRRLSSLLIIAVCLIGLPAILTFQVLLLRFLSAGLFLFGFAIILAYQYMKAEDVQFVHGLISGKERVFKDSRTRLGFGVMLWSVLIVLIGSFGWCVSLISGGARVQTYVYGGRLALAGLIQSLNPADGVLPSLTWRIPGHADGEADQPPYDEKLLGLSVLAVKGFVFLFAGGWALRHVELRSIMRQALSSLEESPADALSRIERVGEVASATALRQLTLAYDRFRHNEPLTVLHLQALGRVQAPDAYTTICEALDDRRHSDVVHEAAIRALGAFGPDEVLPVVRKQFREGPSAVRLACIEVLGLLRDIVLVDDLQALIRDRGTSLRERDQATIAFHLIRQTENDRLDGDFYTELSKRGLVECGVNPQGYRRFRRELDGGHAILVPYGPFRRGSNLSEAERPEREIFLPSFVIDEHPVTVRQFQTFLAKVDIEVLFRQTFGEGAFGREFAEALADTVRNRPEMPITSVSWEIAVLYSRWANKIDEPFDATQFATFGLPLESQWEKAARGTDGRTYPWGNDELTPDRASYLSKRGGLHSVWECETNLSPYGLRNMAGNAWEWCCNYMHEDAWKQASVLFGIETKAEHRVVRGGCWDGYDFYCRANYRLYRRTFPELSRISFRSAVNGASGVRLLENELGTVYQSKQ